MARYGLLVASALTATLVSCTSSPLVPTASNAPLNTQPPIAPSIAPTATPTISPTAPPTPSPTAPIVTAGELTCTGSQLQIAFWPALSGGGAGSVAVSLAIWNRGTRPCRIHGWATLQFLNPAGGLVSTRWVETTATFGGSARLEAISLLPCGESNGCPYGVAPAAFINFFGDDVIEPCVTAARVRVLTPGTSIPVVANLSVQGYTDGQVFCSDGKISVLPVQSAVEALGPTLS